MNKYIYTVLNPKTYHEGWLKPPFFEGWYFKVVDASAENAWAFIVGVFRQPDPEKSQAFIQVLEGNTGSVHNFDFPFSAFSFNADDFEICVAGNSFTLKDLRVNLQDQNFSISGSLSFGAGAPWPVRWVSPGIMGPFGWLNFMECYHGLLSFDHEVTGTLLIDQTELNFDGGRGYIEKDFGKAFPHAWIWLQTNHFKQRGTSLSASIAVIPFAGMRFRGVIVGLWHEGNLHAFITYNGARVKSFEVSENRASLLIKRGKWRLQFDAQRVGGGMLKAPMPSGMDRRITESLNAWVSVRLWEGKQLIFEDTGQRAGMEVVGDMNLLKELV